MSSSYSSLRQMITKVLVPNLDRDLTRSLNQQLSTVPTMTDCFLSPSVYAYESRGAFTTTSMPQQKSLVKIHYPLSTSRGLFD
jgi:hypothetical protein